jgi:hypothetical protein
LSQRIDPDLPRSDRRRLVFVRLADVPHFWRVDLDMRAISVAANDSYDAGNPAAHSEAGWSRPASAIENTIAAIKAAVRRQRNIAAGLLSRGYARINLSSGSAADFPRAITGLADSCAALEPNLADTAAEVHEVVDALSRAELLPPLAVGGVADDLPGRSLQATRSHRDVGCARHTPIGLTKGRFSMLGLRLLL